MSTSSTEALAVGDAVELTGETEAAAPSAAEPARSWTPPYALRAGAPAWVWLGMGVCILGFVLIAIGWGQVAAETQVHLQLPYVVSAAFVGLGLVIVGVAVLNIATRQRDGIDRDRQIAHLVTIMEELRETLAERGRE